MASLKAITPDKLAALGAPALAAALLEHAAGDPSLRKKLNMLLAGTAGPGKLAAELGKRIQAIGRAQSPIHQEKRRPLITELDHIRTTIGTALAPHSPAVAIERLWDLAGIADRVIARVEDGTVEFEDIFDDTTADLGRLIAADPARDPIPLAHRVLALCDASGGRSHAIPHFDAALGPAGRDVLRKDARKTLANLPPRKPGDGWHGTSQRWPLVRRLMIIADLEHDPDAYIAALETGGMADLHVLDIAERLVMADRPAEALQWLDKPRTRAGEPRSTEADLRIAALTALGRTQEVQALRWSMVEQHLSVGHLRAYLNSLPDFEDFDAEQKALALASSHQDAGLALGFLCTWPALDHAATLVRNRITALDGRRTETLRPAAQALEEKHPDAATLLYRHLAESVLDRAASKYYAYAARDLLSATRTAARIPPAVAATAEHHATYLIRLRKQHGRKPGFWTLVDTNTG